MSLQVNTADTVAGLNVQTTIPPTGITTTPNRVNASFFRAHKNALILVGVVIIAYLLVTRSEIGVAVEV